MDEDGGRPSIYRISRAIKRSESTLYNALHSIYEDSIFVAEISELWPDLPVLGNLRCGLWYSPSFDATCYFKSTDGHNNNWSFSTSRLNLHVALLAGQKGGCVIVDSTRKGKRFPDSMSKTIPIWACVLNRAVLDHKGRTRENGMLMAGDSCTTTSDKPAKAMSSWDCSLHLPLWVSETEKAAIEDRLIHWTKQFKTSGADIASVASMLRKPLRPLWISQRTVIWLNELPEYDSWDFTPIILVSASSSNGIIKHRTTSEFSWSYIPGAGDDEESWARGLSPDLFWKHAIDVINLGPGSCNQKVADIVENDRVRHSYRGWALGLMGNACAEEPPMHLGFSKGDAMAWVGSTKLVVGRTPSDANVVNVDCILNCGQELVGACSLDPETYLHLPIVDSKFDRFSVFKNLPVAVKFAELNLSRGRSVLACCDNGVDIGICVCLAIFTSLFNDEGNFDGGKSFKEVDLAKGDVRRRLAFICKYAVNARPSRGNLKQVIGFLCGKKDQ